MNALPWGLVIVVGVILIRWLIKSRVKINKKTESEVGNDMVDMDFYIKDIQHSNEYSIFVLGRELEGKDVGLRIGIKTLIQPGIMNNSLGGAIVKSGFWIESIGEKSDDVLKILSFHYGFPTDKKFTKKVTGSIFSLNEEVFDATKKQEGIFRFKVFFEEETDLYSEIFFNINFTAGLAQLSEKDFDCRENIIKIFSA